MARRSIPSGEVMGVNTAIYSPSGGSVGIAFSIPASTVKSVVAQLKDKGSVSRGWIGVQIQPVTADIADSLGLKKAEGALVAEPQANGPAAKAGIESGDVITAVNGKTVKDARELARTIGGLAPGAAVKLNVLHKGQDKIVNLTLGQLPNTMEAKADIDNDDKGSVEQGNRSAEARPDGCARQQRRRRRQGRRRRHRGRPEECGGRARLQGRRRHPRSRRQERRHRRRRARCDQRRAHRQQEQRSDARASGGSSRFVAVPLAKG